MGGKFFPVLVTILLFAAAFADRASAAAITAGEIVVNEAVGTGTSRKAAEDDAKRSAIEQGIGAFIDGYTEMKDYQVVTDKVFSKAQGIIKKFEVLNERKDADGLITIEARAVVSAAALDGVLGPAAIDMLGNPRVLIIIDERVAEKQPFMYTSEGQVERVFQNSGLHIVDKAQSDVLSDVQLNEARKKQNDEELLRIARNFKADVLVSGKAYAGSFVSVKAGGHPVYSGRASVQLKAVLTNTAQQIAFNTSEADQKITRGTTEEDAAVKGFQICASQGAKKMVNSIAYSMFGSLGAPTYRIKIAGIPFDAVFELIESLETLDGVKSVYQRSYDNGTLELDVVSEMDANALARWLSKNGSSISRVSQQTIDAGWKE
ncbi:MAG: hypothetical protein LBS45_03760 [Synergistaceae bacterium]|jgi:hypothetical protein|nr:hypothetical protein [Synergistaceae bacterium]